MYVYVIVHCLLVVRWNYLKDPLFSKLYDTLDGKVRKLSEDKSKLTSQAKELTKEEYLKILDVVDAATPRGLQHRVFLHCGIWFCFRGRKGHYDRIVEEFSG